MNKKVIHSVFENIVEKKGTNIAVETETKNLSYSELNIQSNRMAHYLENRNINKGDIVASFFNDSLIQLISILGVFKSRAIYLPIDKKYKRNHWGELYDNIRPKVFLTSEENLDLLKSYDKLFNYSIPEVITISINNDNQLIFSIFEYKDGDYTEVDVDIDLPIGNPTAYIDGDDSNYIFFTSGSTGKPKAVLGCHKSLSHFIHWESKELGIKEGDRIGLLPSFSFDASLQAVFMALLNGCTICLPSIEVKEDISKLQHWLRKEKVSVVHMVPTLFRLLSSDWSSPDEDSVTKYEDLRYILLAGEKLYNKDIINWRKTNGDNTSILNFYGTTEATILSTFYPVEKELKGEPSEVLCVGKPISNTVILILNSENKLCRIGEVGSIYIRTPFLSKGYYNDEEQTAEKFIKNPLGDQKDIIYKTGDYGKYDSDRNTIVLGREDGIAKINGVRVDINSIESTILKIEEVSMVKCLLHQDKEMNSILVCFYKSENVDQDAVRNYCLQYLSQYETPSLIIRQDTFPINANGKIDPVVLEQKINDVLVKNQNYKAPTTKTEEKLATIWKQVLKLEKVGAKDNFLLLGGNSIKLIQLKLRIHQTFNVDLDIHKMFNNSILEEQANLIEQSKVSTFEIIDKLESEETYELSSSQHRLWVLSQFDQGSIAYNMPFSVKLNGEYDVPNFKKAIDKTIERHEILRTVFRVNELGEIRQQILSKDALNFKIDYVDFRGKEKPEEKAKQYEKEDSYIAFNLEQGPLIRAFLLQISDEEYVFYFNMHHIISDGWSMKVLIKDVLDCYEALKINNDASMVSLNIQYKEYVAWQKKQLLKDRFKESKKYWLNQFSGELPILDFPSSKIRPKIKTYKGHQLSTSIPSETIKKLKAYGQYKEGSLFVGLLAAWNILCNRFTGQNDIIIGTPTSGRDHVDLENQIGFYVNTLALRNQIDSTDTFNEIYDKVRTATFSSFDHQMYPFDNLVEDLDLIRNSSRSALFDVMLVLQNVVDNDFGSTIEEKDCDYISDDGICASKFDIELTFQEIGDALSFIVKYNSDIYDQHMIESIIRNYKQLIIQLVNNPDSEIRKVDYLSKEEKFELLHELNNTDVSYAQDKTIIDVFTEQVKQNPDEIAIEFDNRKITYLELDNLSNKWSNYLVKEHNLCANDLVGIKLERNDWLLICILGVLKVGAAYVPIDPSYPKSKIDYIKEDCKCKTFIDSKELAFFKETQSSYSVDYEDQKIDPKSVSYVIYTSGSTGMPKGVMIEHISMMNYLNWAQSYYLNNGLSNSDFGLFTSLSFDLTVTSLFLPILSGSRLKVFKQSLEITDLLKQYFESTISCIKLTPAHISLLENMELEANHLEMAIVGGDVLYQNQVGTLRKLNPAIKIYNEYGPTEATVGCIVYEIPEKNTNVLIGRPIQNTQVYILDELDNLQPKGVVGEICIGGDGLARGYLNRLKLNEERFINNPFKEGEKLYKTGDLARWLPNGNIQFLGRRDNQVKIRGHRIELGEIEYHLQSKNSISEAVVVLKNEGDFDIELLAYIVSNKKQERKKLYDYLSDKLPRYMIPDRFIQIKNMPITTNGKIDKKALSNIKGEELINQVEFELATTKIEKSILEIWKEVLGKDRIGINDNFFELGGNSIKAVKILYKINTRFETNMSMKNLFQYPTIQYVASQIGIIKKQESIIRTSKKLKEIEL
ncbi:amino acid adenylation domain-containing protein [Aquimarina sp. M1]